MLNSFLGRFSFLSEQVGANELCPTSYRVTSNSTLTRRRQLQLCDGRCIHMVETGHRFWQVTLSVMNPKNGTLDMYLSLNVSGLHCNDRRLLTMYHMQYYGSATQPHECLFTEFMEFSNFPDITQCKFRCSGIYGNSTLPSHDPAVSIQFENLLGLPTDYARLCGVDVSFA